MSGGGAPAADEPRPDLAERFQLLSEEVSSLSEEVSSLLDGVVDLAHEVSELRLLVRTTLKTAAIAQEEQTDILQTGESSGCVLGADCKFASTHCCMRCLAADHGFGHCPQGGGLA